MTVSGKNKIELNDILIGDIWIGSGQSNMEMGISACDKAKEEIPAANYTKIRLMLVPKIQVAAPGKDVKADWVVCSPKTVAAGGWGGFSAAL
jgi:sialate O-acetylesterase